MSTGDGPDKTQKRRAACDECRSKKLKCTGEQPHCARCVREGVSCVYSPQKQMGRPKKRARQEDDVDLSGWYDSQRAKAVKQSQPLPLPESSSSDWPASTSLQNAWDGFPGLDANTSDTLAFLEPWTATGQQLDLTRDVASVPGLTPDSSNGSPHVHNPQQQSHTEPFPLQDITSQIHLDPTLCGFSTLGPACACLSSMYLSLNTLQSMDSTFTFPFALHPLREAMQVGAECIACDLCPKRFITGVQNTQILGTLLLSIAERYGKVLESITTEAKRAKDAGETKKFRMADLNTSTSHLHHGGIGCRAAFNIDLEPDEWHMMAKKVVKAEVFGPSPSSSSTTSTQQQSTTAQASSSTDPLEPPHCPGGSGGEHTDCAYFIGLTQQMIDRQTKWHQKPMAPDAPKGKDGTCVKPASIPKDQHLCLKMPAFARKVVEGFDWS